MDSRLRFKAYVESSGKFEAIEPDVIVSLGSDKTIRIEEYSGITYAFSTGVFDSNGTEIFQYDIVSLNNKSVFGELLCKVSFDNGAYALVNDFGRESISKFSPSELEVVGSSLLEDERRKLEVV